MDFLTLCITGKSLHAPLEPKRLGLAAALGAAFATLSVLITSDSPISFFLSSVAFAACTLGMCALAYKKSVFRSAAVFTAVNLGLGGMISVMCEWLRKSGFAMSSGSSLEAPTLLLFALIAGAVSLLYDRLRTVKKREVSAVIKLFGKSIKLRLLCDSGDLLCEPISKKPVVIVSPMVIGMSELPENMPEELRLCAIPTEAVTGKRLIYGFFSELEVEGRLVSAVIAPIDTDFGGFDGIIPESLL